VGSIIEAFASEHAMVKVGTVIDPDMRDELHVTVVATGLGGDREKPTKVVDNSRTLDGTTDYNQLDRPAVLRRRAVARGNVAIDQSKENQEQGVDYLDIPAFLRRQAD
jgi:cell division protein FtsZ